MKCALIHGVGNRTILMVMSRHMLHFGDTAVDMKTAIEANMFPVGVPWGFRSAEELQKSGTQILIKKPSDILNINIVPI